MIYTIQNEHLTVKIHEKGATLWSIQDKDSTELNFKGITGVNLPAGTPLSFVGTVQTNGESAS